MNLRRRAYMAVLAWAVSSSAALAQESLEKVVVRNRLYTVDHRWEVGASVGFTLVSELTSHTNLTLDSAYNFSETLAVESRLGYAVSGHTGLADQIGADVMANQVSAGNNGWPNVVDDLSGLWEMKFNGVVGLRWAPIYGKISLFSEFPVHFQAYLAVDGGAANFNRQSVVYCLHAAANATCSSWETETKVTWLASAAFGLRLFTHGSGAVKLEARDYSWPDSYLLNIDRRIGQQGGATGTAASSPGLTNLLLVDLGYTFFF